MNYFTDMPEWIAAFDTRLFVLLNAGPANPVFDWFFPFITELRHWILPLAAGAFFWIRKEKKKGWILLGLAALTVAVTDPVCARLLKPLFGRLRPCHPEVLVEGGRFLLGQKTSYAFPSCHASNSFGLAAFFCFFYPRHWIWFFVTAVLIGYSRIYCGVHYPLDVAGGALVGTTVGGAVWLVANRVGIKASG